MKNTFILPSSLVNYLTALRIYLQDKDERFIEDKTRDIKLMMFSYMLDDWSKTHWVGKSPDKHQLFKPGFPQGKIYGP